jgi:DUF971 family protein
MRSRPTHISVSKSKGVLVIDWDDNRRCEYPFATLRAACPCAECRGGHSELSGTNSSDDISIPLQSAQASKLERIEVVGNYALQMVWADGHSFGIYPWDYLKALCPEIKLEGEEAE